MNGGVSGFVYLVRNEELKLTDTESSKTKKNFK